MGLAEKRDCAAAALSGGMKRKLQVALALLGNSRVVLLGGGPSPSLAIHCYGIIQLGICRAVKGCKAVPAACKEPVEISG